MGTRVCYLGFVCLCQDHPHAYGDKQLSLTLSVMLRGSSPRVWGQASNGTVTVIIDGIIPTRMGTSMQKLIRNSGVRDHPHAYGDKYSLAFPGFPELGSSPRVWGQAVRQAQSCHMNRIIPTRMGTSYGDIVLYSLPWDHPHAYGDKYTLGFPIFTRGGSSPRVWGQVHIFTSCP